LSKVGHRAGKSGAEATNRLEEPMSISDALSIPGSGSLQLLSLSLGLITVLPGLAILYLRARRPARVALALVPRSSRRS
jgi:hypothetical protein